MKKKKKSLNDYSVDNRLSIFAPMGLGIYEIQNGW